MKRCNTQSNTKKIKNNERKFNMDKYIETYDFSVTSTLETSKTIHEHFQQTKSQQKEFIDAFSDLLINALNDKTLEELK